jgi:hypothetical protein
VISALAGATLCLSYFLNMFTLSNDAAGWTHSWPTSADPDSPLLVVFGILLIAAGVGRFYTNHIVFRVLTLVFGLLALALSLSGAQMLVDRFDMLSGNLAVTFTYGPAMFVIGTAAVVAVVGSVTPMQLKRGPGNTRTGRVIASALGIVVVAAIVEHAVSIGPIT